VFIGVLVLWEVLVNVLEIPSYVLPKPSTIATEISGRAPSLLNHMKHTFFEALGGFLIGSWVAFVTAVIFVNARVIEKSMYPWAIVFQTVPIVAIAPLLTIWLGFGILPKMIISAIICFFPMLVNSLKGLRAVSPQALELMDILSASPKDIFLRLRLPSSLPFVFTGLKVTSTFSFAGAIVGEFTGADFGIGKVILVASYQQQPALMFAGLTYSSVSAILFFMVISLLEKRFVHWEPEL